jgi:DNA (cytosine-5)-methyltransferase 1
MNPKEKLKNIYSLSFSIADIQDIPQQYLKYILLIGEQAYKLKGVYTVLVTLLTYKSLFPEQDIRKHQSRIPGGFSGRSIDNQYITPTLKELGLPSMAESGWLTRSLEQSSPYTLD